MNIHPTAIIDPAAEIGENVKIGPFCTIGPHVKIGNDNKLASSVVISGHTTIGDGNAISPGVVIGTAPQDLKYAGEPTQVIIGNNNTIREYVTINASASLTEHTTLGNNCLIMAYCHVAHNCHLGNNVILSNAVNMAGHVTIHDFAIIGGMAAVNQFCKIGKYTFIGGMSGIRKDVPPYTRGAGEPFKVTGLNIVGLQRKGFDAEQITSIKRIYKWFYATRSNVSKRMSELGQLGELSPEEQVFIDFIKESDRGICK